MKNLKFRIWDKVENKYIFITKREDYDWLAVAVEHPELYNVQQFTGLLDKQSKEIYEGDIIKDEKNIFEIILVPGGFVAIEPKEKKSSFPIWNELANPQMHSWIANAEVIGNIYEKENLLSD